ncbi:hypothetical protein PPHE_a3614 [Pseudoalteromonas phenolica O-BC30]|nr:hypothetical protein [Pseudoalteromonas phenolica O-BC30]
MFDYNKIEAQQDCSFAELKNNMTVLRWHYMTVPSLFSLSGF